MYSNNSSFVSLNQSLGDITVGEILESYKHDTDLLKYILVAKSEEDKRKGAEETRKTEEAILQSKFIDLQLDQNYLDDASLGFSSSDWLPYNDLASPFINNSPLSPSHLPISTYTTFDTLNPSPEPIVERNPCKRTFSRTRSTRKPSVKALSKKNRSSQIHPQKELIKESNSEGSDEQKKEPSTLSHNKVIEALRAKLQRSTQPQPKPGKIEPVTMSPSGILLLDLKNPKRIFPLQNPRTLLG
ncbi:unnamed protein product [Rhizopus stolonifer]